jgi:hypothetical protein
MKRLDHCAARENMHGYFGQELSYEHPDAGIPYQTLNFSLPSHSRWRIRKP